MEIYTLVHIFKTKQPIINCNTSMCRYGNSLHFIYWHRRGLTCLWGRYDQKTENRHTFTVILAMCCNQSSIVILLFVGLATYYISFIDTEDVWRMHENVMTRKLKITCLLACTSTECCLNYSLVYLSSSTCPITVHLQFSFPKKLWGHQKQKIGIFLQLLATVAF